MPLQPREDGKRDNMHNICVLYSCMEVQSLIMWDIEVQNERSSMA